MSTGCKDCANEEAKAQRERQAINNAKEIAKTNAKKQGIKTVEIVRVINGSYSWKPFGTEHQHQVIEYLLVD